MDKLKYIFENAKVGIAICNAKSNTIEMVNAAFAQMHGYEPEELSGVLPGNVFATECRCCLVENGGAPIACPMGEAPFEALHLRKDGSSVPVSVQITPINDENGVAKYRILNVVDIKEKQETKEKLKNSETIFRSIVENLPGFAFIFKLCANGKEEFLYASDGVLDAYGVDASMALSDIATTRRLIHKEDIPVFKAAIAKSAAALEPFYAEFRVCNPLKGELWLESRAIPEAQADGSVIWHGITVDVTERKLYQIQAELVGTAVDYAGDAVYISEFDEESVPRFTFVNQKACDMLDYSRAELLGKSPLDIDTLITKEALASMAHEKQTTVESLYKTKEDRLIPVEICINVFSRNNKTLSVSVVRDISERKKNEEILYAREQEFRVLVENSPNPTVRYDRECRRIYVNPACKMLSSYTQDELTGVTPRQKPVLSVRETERVYQAVNLVVQSKEAAENEIEVILPDESVRYYQCCYTPEFDTKGEVCSVLMVSHDMTERLSMEKELKRNELILKEAQKIAKVGSWELDFSTQKLIWSDEIYRIFELTNDGLAPRYEDFLAAIHPEDREAVNFAYSESLKNKMPYEAVHRLLLSGGRIKYIHEKGETHYDANGEPLRSVGTAQDVTERNTIEKKIEFLAHHDELTGLPNRMLTKDRVEHAIAHAKRTGTKVAILCIDIDNFKTINDSLGHAIGDVMLRVAAARLKEYIRECDTLGRHGGDEFIAVLTDVYSIDDVSAAAEKLLKEFEKPFCLGSHILSVSISIGVAMSPDDGDNFDTLLQKADTAVYKAKEDGRNAYCFFAERMNSEIMEHLQIQNDLKKAIDENEFILHYQPQIDLAENKIGGAEALIRWRHPKNGLVPPMKFIPVAESSGLIAQIGEWVIREACRQAAEWERNGISLTMAVNISAVQFKKGNLEEIVKSALEESGLNPELLELELTESILIHDTENVLQAVKRLKAIGIKLSIDDFGTGYSSLSYLKRFAVDKLKIDQSFVRDILKDPEDAVIVKAVIQMAKSLNLKTIAEGVENADVLAVISGHGCDEVQGYHFAKPMPSSEFESYYQASGI